MLFGSAIIYKRKSPQELSARLYALNYSTLGLIVKLLQKSKLPCDTKISLLESWCIKELKPKDFTFLNVGFWYRLMKKGFSFYELKMLQEKSRSLNYNLKYLLSVILQCIWNSLISDWKWIKGKNAVLKRNVTESKFLQLFIYPAGSNPDQMIIYNVYM